MPTPFSFGWIGPRDDVSSLIALRRAIYGQELGWITEGSEVTWDAYDQHSTALVVVDEGGQLVASGRLSLERDGPLEVSDLVDWRGALPPALRDAPAAEWSRVMIRAAHRGQGLFRAMYALGREAAVRGGARLLAGASVEALRPRYQALGFTYLDRPFRSPFFDASPTYLPAYQELP